MAFLPQHWGSRSAPFSSRRSKARRRSGIRSRICISAAIFAAFATTRSTRSAVARRSAIPCLFGRGIAEPVQLFDLQFDFARHIPRFPG